MELIQIRETLYALPVPIDAHSFTANNTESYYRGKTNYLSEIWCRKDNYSERIYSIDDNVDIKIIGTVTQEEIDFDCLEYCDIDRGKIRNKLYLLRLIDSKGITPTPETKLLIIEKV